MPLTESKSHQGLVFCHRKPERSFFYKGAQFPLCARCTGIFFGFLSLFYFTIGITYFNPLMAIALILPTYLDGWFQALFDWESTNWRRFTTGLIAGIGIMSLTAWIGQNIGIWLQQFF
jgi:uncharacterized membrane protein